MGYDDDDLYDDEYDEDEAGEEELSPEDQEQMRLGTVKVRQELGSSYKVSDKAIHDALWNYYYDVAKSVAHLKDAHKPIQPKQPKPPSRFDQAAGAAAQTTGKSPFIQDNAVIAVLDRGGPYMCQSPRLGDMALEIVCSQSCSRANVDIPAASGVLGDL